MIIDILFTILLLLPFYWLMRETKWMTVVILYGSPSKYMDVSELVNVAIGIVAYMVADNLMSSLIETDSSFAEKVKTRLTAIKDIIDILKESMKK